MSRCYVCNAEPQDGCQAIGGEMAECPRPSLPRAVAMSKTLCWKCSKEYQADEEFCPHCCATNASRDAEAAQAEAADNNKIDHEWEFQDDSFDHAFGTERVHYFRCERCGETRGMEPGDYDDRY